MGTESLLGFATAVAHEQSHHSVLENPVNQGIRLYALQAGVQDNGTLSITQKAAVRSTMRQLAQAISYIHQQGVTHRDIKPENVLLQDNGNIALCDFGISRDIINSAYESTVNLTGAAGTLDYCAPEAGRLALF